MNPKLLNKILDELNKEIPRIDYIRGIVETLIDLQLGSNIVLSPPLHAPYTWSSTTMASTEKPIPIDDASILDSQAKAALAKTIDLANKSLE